MDVTVTHGRPRVVSVLFCVRCLTYLLFSVVAGTQRQLANSYLDRHEWTYAYRKKSYLGVYRAYSKAK